MLIMHITAENIAWKGPHLINPDIFVLLPNQMFTHIVDLFLTQ